MSKLMLSCSSPERISELNKKILFNTTETQTVLPELPQVKRINKSKTGVSIFSDASLKKKGQIRFEDFWSSKMKAEVWKMQKKKALKEIDKKIQGFDCLEKDIAEYVKLKFFRNSPRFFSPDLKKLSQIESPTIEKIIGKCDSLLKKTAKTSEKIHASCRILTKNGVRKN